MSDSAERSKWGHLRPGHFRFILTPASDYQRDDDSSTSSFDDEVDRASFARTTRRLAVAANEIRTRVVGEISKALFKEDPKVVEEIDPRTPEWVTRCGYKILLVGTVPLEGLKSRNERKKLGESLVETIVTYLNPRSVGRVVALSRAWANAGYADPLYYDLLQVGRPLATFYAHSDRIETLSCYDADTILSSSRQGIVQAFRHDGESYGCGKDTAVVDTTVIARILVACGSLWAASANGAIREWSMPHDVERIEFKSQLWEHTKTVNDLCDGLGILAGRSVGGRIVSCSDDRTARIWNVVTKRCDLVIRPFTHLSATMCAVCVGGDQHQHLYVGSSRGTVHVFSAQAGEEAHELEQLENGTAVISCIKTSQMKLFVASYDGRVRVWEVACFGGEGPLFVLAHTLADHTDRITSLQISLCHAITASDDHTIRFYGLYQHGRQPPGMERVLDAQSRIKCLDLHAVGGILVCGMSDGSITVYPCGPSI